jgi:hypothetical protein
MESLGMVGMVIAIVAGLIVIGIFWSFFGVWIRAWLAACARCRTV